MKHQKSINVRRWRRKNRVRKNIRGSADHPRLSVHRTNKHMYCQLIDDESGKTLCSASSRDKDLAGQVKNGGNCEGAKAIGAALAEKAKSAGIKRVKFDRGRFKYHGRVAQVCDAVREAGLEV